MQPIEIFRAGTHTASDGRTIAFAASDVAAMVSAYDPAVHEAPIVVGHPKADAPAYGWVGALALRDGRVSATPQQLDPAFAEMVAKGRFKKVSASFYGPDSPGNPKPGGYYLRHVGFLGAQPPAIKGLKSIAFAEAEEGVVEFDDPWAAGLVATLFGRVRDFMIGQFGQERADAVLPADAIDQLKASATAEQMRDAVEASSGPDYQEQSKEPSVAGGPDRSAEFAEREAVLAEREAALLAREAADRRRDNAALLDRLVKEGRLLPASKAATLAFMDALDHAGVVEFGEAGAKAPLAMFRELLAAQGRVVEFSEIAGGDGRAAANAGDPHTIIRAAAEFQEAEAKAGREVPWAAAVAHVCIDRDRETS